MENDEADVFQKMVKRRARCLAFLRADGNGGGGVQRVVDVSHITRLEAHVDELWKRLEMDVRKGTRSPPLELEQQPPWWSWLLLQNLFTAPAES